MEYGYIIKFVSANNTIPIKYALTCYTKKFIQNRASFRAI